MSALVFTIGIGIKDKTFIKCWPNKSCEITLEIIEKMFLTNSKDESKNIERLEILDTINVKLNTLKTLVRLACDTGCINQSKYLQLQEKLQEIGRMNGGWIKYIKQQTPLD